MKPLLILLSTLGGASAAVISVTDSATTLIPDGSSSGVVRTLFVVSAPGDYITGVEVDIDLGAAPGFTAFLGDLYIYLQHGADLAVLTNRVGRRAGSSGGYGDNQPMNVTFSMLATNDIHNYRLTLNGNHTTPLTGALTGTWQPDGRAVDPAVALDTSPRTAGLDVFSGDDANGVWGLLAVDMSTGATHQINAWTLRLTTVPEPGSAVLAAGVAAFAFTRRRRTPSAQ